MPGTAYTKLFEIATDQYGYITQTDANDAGFSVTVLRDMARHGDLDRVGWGLYRFVAFPVSTFDHYMEATLWPRPVQGVISHETALELHDLCDVNPHKTHLTVPRGFRTKRPLRGPIELHRRELKPSDVTRNEGITVVTARRAILDGLEANLALSLIEQAIDTAQRRGMISRDETAALEAAAATRWDRMIA